MNYQQILSQVRHSVFQAFSAMPKRKHLWAHSFAHVARVVNNARELLKSEADRLAPAMAMSPRQFAFLVEMACWLHDLGRTVENKPSYWGGEFNHALESEKMARKILKPYVIPAEAGIYKNVILNLFQDLSRFRIRLLRVFTGMTKWAGMTKEEIALVLQAVAEHNQPTPKHPENLVTRLLQDADRGDGFSYQGMVMILNYTAVINTPQTETEAASRKVFLEILPQLLADPLKRRQTRHWLKHLCSWYTGGPALAKNGSHQFGKEIVCSLYTQTAKKIYANGFKLIQKYLKIVEKAEEREEHYNKISNF